jgi:shikimate dehydrogenase
MGWPVAHSRSPALHNFWLEEHGIDGVYVPLPVRPDQLKEALLALPVLGFRGCNLTIPHKPTALSVVDRVDPLARRIGAINTVIVAPDGSLEGRNTDVYGFIENLREGAPDWQAARGPAVVLGAGGAARAVVYGLLQRGVRNIAVINRSQERAEALRERLGAGIRTLPWEERNAALTDAGLLVNTTTLGMHGQPDLAIEVERLPAHAVITDLVYVPLQTPLLRAAIGRKLRTADGLGMLLHQAVRGFSLWFGQKPEITAELRALAEADLGT